MQQYYQAAPQQQYYQAAAPQQQYYQAAPPPQQYYQQAAAPQQYYQQAAAPQQYYQQVQQAAAPRSMQVSLPADAYPGRSYQAQTPEGQPITFEVPANAGPGQVVTLTY